MRTFILLSASVLFCACATNSQELSNNRQVASENALEERLSPMLGAYRVTSDGCSIGFHRSIKDDIVKVNFVPREIETHFGQKIDTGDWVTFQVIESKVPDYIDSRASGAQGVMISSDYTSLNDKILENLQRSVDFEGAGNKLKIVSKQSYMFSGKQYNHVRTIFYDGTNLIWSVGKTPGYSAQTCKFAKINEQ